MKAHDCLRGVFDVVLAKAEADPAFAADLMAAIAAVSDGEPPKRSKPRERAAPAPAPTAQADVDLDALYKELGRVRCEAELASPRFTIKQLKAMTAREGFTAPSGRAVKSDWAYALARQLARRHGDASLDAA